MSQVGIAEAAVSHLRTEYVLKRVVPPAPSPAEEAREGRAEAERARADRIEAALRDTLRPPRRRRLRARKRRQSWR